MKIKIDSKCTIWHRAYYDIPDFIKEEEIVNFIDTNGIEEDGASNYIFDTVEDMSLKNNGGKSTLEILNEKGDIIWTNEKI